ncbi:MAG: type III pantothenate kinase [Bacteroidales bacterium]|nr:type III pantothenate kinase [Bacteroidales bacterium]
MVIDIGNTLTKLAVFQNDKLVESYSFKGISKETIAGIQKKYPGLKKCLISSVVDVSPDIKRFLDETMNYFQLDETTPLPLKVNYKTPETLGNDRIAAVVMGNALYPDENVLVVEAGTAITYDFVDGQGIYHGGGISPGIDMRFRALNSFTHKLPLIEKAKSPGLIGNSTTDSILSGVMNGVIAEVDGIIDNYRNYTDNQLKVVIGGGDCFYFDRKLKNNIFVLQNIVIEGLNKILLYNFE